MKMVAGLLSRARKLSSDIYTSDFLQFLASVLPAVAFELERPHTRDRQARVKLAKQNIMKIKFNIAKQARSGLQRYTYFRGFLWISGPFISPNNYSL